VVECKQSRADFLRDSRVLESLLDRRRDLDRCRQELEDRVLRAAEPHLRASRSMLFPEMEAWDFHASRSASYRELLRELRSVDRQIHGETKFWAIGRYCLADLLLIAAPAGLLRPEELPPGWGLLEFTSGQLEEDKDAGEGWPRLRGAERRSSRPAHRQRLLRNIAVAASRATWPRIASGAETEPAETISL
jgi:hypothetical protein